MEKINLLIIEDDELAASLMSDFLTECDFSVEVVHTVTDGLSYIKNRPYDVLLLDLNLPDFSGFDMLKEIKNHHSLPIIVISAYSETSTKVKAFNFGASDYIVKPVDFKELEARIWSLLGRHSQISINNKCEIFRIDNDNIYFKEEILKLTNTEFELLKILIQNRNKVIKREILSESLSSISSNRSLDYHIKNLRVKLKEGNNPTYLQTEYGIGYKLVYQVYHFTPSPILSNTYLH
jgi:DNA-binding response OmpR family regulator